MNMKKGLNFRTLEGQKDYFKAYDESLKLFNNAICEKYISTDYGESHVIISGSESNPPLVLLHAASCGSTIWYKNIAYWSETYCVYAIDLIGESSKSLLSKKMTNTYENAKWLDETITGLGLKSIYLCGLSIGGWNAANYASFYPDKVMKLVLLSPVQTFSKMYSTFFLKIMKMGFHPTRENVEKYIGWGSEKEGKLPDSIINQFTISVMNINSNASFPKWLKKDSLKKINMPVLVMLGENEFAFSISKAEKRARAYICHLDFQIVTGASHLIPVSKPEIINHTVMDFLTKKD